VSGSKAKALRRAGLRKSASGPSATLEQRGVAMPTIVPQGPSYGSEAAKAMADAAFVPLAAVLLMANRREVGSE
jgi:hypothetical protein